MALAAIAYAKAMRRRQFMVATTSIGPGALNLVTAAGVAMANRLPVLLLVRRHVPEPPARPGAAAGRALRRPVDDGQRRLPGGRPLLGPDHPAGAGHPVAAPGDRRDARPGGLRAGVHRPAPGRPGARPTTSRLRLFEPVVHEIARPRPDAGQLARGRSPPCAQAQRPLIVAGGGVHYSLAEDDAGGVRRAPRHPGRRDGRRQVDADPRPSVLRRADRGDRRRGSQPPRRRGRRRARRRHPPRRLRHRIVVGVPGPGRPHRRRQRGALRRRQAPVAAGRRRRPRDARRARRRRSPTGARRRRGRRGSRPRWPTLWDVPRPARPSRSRRAADLRPGRRAPSTTGRPATTTPSRRRAASRAS